MNWKTLLAGTVLGLSLLAPAAYAQNGAKKTLRLEAMTAPSFKEQQTVTPSFTYSKGRFGAFGFVDVYGRDSDKCYGELQMRENLTKSSGIHFELNKGCGGTPTYRTGYIFDIPLPKHLQDRAYANVKVLPVNFTKDGLLRETQIGTFATLNLGKGFYVENWTDFTVDYSGKHSTLTKFTLGKKLKDHMAIQGQAAHDVNSPGWAGLVGFRLTF